MKHRILYFAALLLPLSCSQAGSPDKVVMPVNFSDVHIDDSFWTPRLNSHKNVTLGVCIDQIENQTGRIRNFENAAKGEGGHSGIYFDDSDVYKALEGMAYSLQNNPDPELEAKCDEWIAKMAAAQQEDGYINTYYTLTDEERWTKMEMHEMYCAGHMFEAAVAYYNVTGKKTLLDVSEKMADHMMSIFGPGKRDWVPGHEEVELALVKLYETTGKKKYLDFAHWLIEERGHGLGATYDWATPVYAQDDRPAGEMRSIGGHSVRAMYLYCGMADVASYVGEASYMESLDSLWEDTVYRNMYITGGIGQSASNEGFTRDYSLPNDSAYCETCASIGMVLWNWRMNQMTGDARYVDVLERDIFNGVLSGISIDGDKFFYVNPLESYGRHHRQAWYGCACCPSNLCRFIPSIGNYAYGTSDDAIWVNLYMGNTASFKAGGRKVSISQKTGYPWNGDVRISFDSKYDGALKLRIPQWCSSYSVSVNSEAVEADVEKGYAVLEGPWKKGDSVNLVLDMGVRMVAADPRVLEDAGMRAVQRGPVVYCLEGVDNPEYASAALCADTAFETSFEESLLGGVQTLSTGSLKFIPYYAWDNRDAGPMKVWIPYAE